MDLSPSQSPESSGIPQHKSSSNSPAHVNAASTGSTAHAATAFPAGPGISYSATGATVIDPSVEPSSALNPRSCVTCRRRKVRCDKHMPCGNCRKARISCVFPAPGRAPRRPRPRDPNAPPKQSSEREVELIKRLRKLEGIVEELSGQIEVDGRHPSSSGGSPEGVMEEADKVQNNASNFAPLGGYSSSSMIERLTTADDLAVAASSPTSSFNKNFGKLVLNHKGNSRYVSNAFLTKMNEELDKLRVETQRLTDEESDESGDEDFSPDGSHDKAGNDPVYSHQSFILGYRSADVDLRKLHPLPSQIPFIWQIYTENVDPLVKLLHVPTMNGIIRKLRADMSNMDPGLEALMFAIYFAAITSLEDDEVKTALGAERCDLLKQYRFGTEQALAKANFLNTSDLVVVQAFTLFLVIVRRYDASRFAWTLTGLMIRIAQSLGIHREGSYFSNLTPFEIEMRRRLWWVMCIVDLRSAEDQGTELTVAPRSFDTRLPLNVNDADISPDMKEFPKERVGATDMTFGLVRYEICLLARRFHSITNATSVFENEASILTLRERESMALELFERIENKYLKTTHGDGDILHSVAAAIARLIMSKMSLIVYQPILISPHEQELSPELRNRLLLSCIEVLENSRLLNTEPKWRHYRWLFQTYTQWQAVAFILLEVSRLPWSSNIERGWLTLSNVFQDAQPREYKALVRNSAAWLPLKKLMIKATRHREVEVARLRADPQAAMELDKSTNNRSPPAGFHDLPSSIRGTLAQERWRKLVGLPTAPPTDHGGCFPDPPSEKTPTPLNQRGTTTAEPEMSQVEFDYISSVMTAPSFIPTDIYALQFPGGANELLAGNNFGMGEHMGSVMPSSSAQPSMMRLPTGNNTMGRTGSSMSGEGVPSTMPGSAMPQSAVLAAATGMVDDNPPPWLWSDAWKWNEADSGVARPVSDTDVPMEDDFNWQDWQQSLRGFEVDAGLGMGLAPSGGGFSAGL
ncbi:fungal-specific transcription factor domain-containing protein [Xylariales sp. PMI_506]|nr:fungal-specific transcription factor domain-containing protein [Xylariales sp. PMI_506]